MAIIDDFKIAKTTTLGTWITIVELESNPNFTKALFLLPNYYNHI